VVASLIVELIIAASAIRSHPCAGRPEP
jgi:hypothetical protein